MEPTKEESPVCSFCGKGMSDKIILVKGANANICNICVGICLEVIVEQVLKPK